MNIDIKELTKISLQPDEVLSIELAKEYPPPKLIEIDRSLKEIFPANKVMIIPFKMVKEMNVVKFQEKK